MSVERATGHSRQRDCPACNAPSVMLPVFTTRRRRPVTCTNCGQRLEVVYPRASYYSLALVTALLLEASLLPVLFMAFFAQWPWIAVIIAANLVTNYLVSAFLNSHASVTVDDLDEVSRKEVFGRWFPK